MKVTAGIMALCLCASAASMAQAQDSGATTTTPAPSTSDVGTAAGAASQTMGEQLADMDNQVHGDTPSELAPGTTVLPNGMDITPDYEENGRWYNAEGIPTYKMDEGVIDFATFNGFRRYHAECHVCHGPDGEGSTYAPALKTSVLNIDYYQFQEVVASGKQQVNASANQVMPAFATNKNVWCYIDDIYTYLLARGTGDLPRGRPADKGPKSDEFAAQEDSCMSM